MSLTIHQSDARIGPTIGNAVADYSRAAISPTMFASHPGANRLWSPIGGAQLFTVWW